VSVSATVARAMGIACQGQNFPGGGHSGALSLFPGRGGGSKSHGACDDLSFDAGGRFKWANYKVSVHCIKR
jgi:hypothetical protein